MFCYFQHFEVAHEQFAETHGAETSLALRTSLGIRKKAGTKDFSQKIVAEDREISAQLLSEAYTVVLCKIANAIIASLKLDPRSKVLMHACIDTPRYRYLLDIQ